MKNVEQFHTGLFNIHFIKYCFYCIHRKANTNYNVIMVVEEVVIASGLMYMFFVLFIQFELY